MHLGILQTGLLPDDLVAAHGDYPDLFDALLRPSLPDLRLSPFRVVEEHYPEHPQACEAWLITGSRHGVYEDHPWIAPLETFVRECLSAQRPVVGICFGHQLMAQALGGTVVKSDRGWGLGIGTYRLDADLPWLGHTPSQLTLQRVHQDQVITPPPGAEVIGGNEHCPYGILRYGRFGFSVQPHPEFTAAFMRDLITARRGTLYAEPVADAALETLDAPVDSAQVGAMIASFLRATVPTS